MKHLLVVSALGILSGCSDPTAPPYQLPSADPSLDPGALSMGQYIYVCGGWATAGAPATTYAVVDVQFGQRSGDPSDRPVREELDVIYAVGGWPLAAYNFPAVRAYVPTAAIPEISKRWPWVSVHSVPDERRYDWVAIVSFSHAITSADSAAINSMGGRVTRDLANLNMLIVLMPNTSFPTLRRSRGVVSVEPDSPVCLL